MPVYTADIVIVGGGVGGCAAALSATEMGCRVVMTEEHDWIGGQFTSQAVPPDEHPWIESYGRTASYARFRTLVRQYYRDHRALTQPAAADPLLNPGQGWVSALCCEPRVALAALEEMLAPACAAGLLAIKKRVRPIAAESSGDRVSAVTLLHVDTGETETLTAAYFLDATELGDLLPLAQIEYRTGAESQAEFGELHAPPTAQPDNVQALTWCFPVAFDAAPDAYHTIERPASYEFWRDFVPALAPSWPGKLLDLTYTNPTDLAPRRLWVTPLSALRQEPDLFTYRRIVSAAQYQPGIVPHDVTLVNWPQNDYLPINVIDRDRATIGKAYSEAKQLSLSLLYWMQTEMPRSDGGAGYPGLYLRPDISGTADGLAMAPYIREARRIRAVFTVTEEHVGAQMLKEAGRSSAVSFDDSIGVGHYRIDLHPTTGGDNYIDIESRSFQIPLGALLPQRVLNVLPAGKNAGVTHITNGCYRLHPVEWNIGESAGFLAAWCFRQGYAPHQVREDQGQLAEFQALIAGRGVEIEWPSEHQG